MSGSFGLLRSMKHGCAQGQGPCHCLCAVLGRPCFTREAAGWVMLPKWSPHTEIEQACVRAGQVRRWEEEVRGTRLGIDGDVLFERLCWK